MTPGKFSYFRKPWLWACVTGLGVMQLFTVATAPFDKVATSQHQPQRVPAAAEPVKNELKVDKDVSKPSPDGLPSEAPAGAKALASDERIIMMSWNVKALAREGSDYDRAALVLADADVVVLQEMDLNSQGKGFLNVLGALMETRTKQKFCRAWIQAPDGTRLHYGFLWRESAIGYMESDGLMHDDCGQVPFVIRQDKRVKNGVHASFYSKNPRKMFELAAVLFEKKPRAASEVNELFRDLSDKQWPVIVAGDFKTGVQDSVLHDVASNGYQYALDSSKRSGRSSQENFWYRNAVLASSGTVNLYQRFGDSRRQDIEKGLSDLFPIAIEMRTREESKEEMTSALVAKAAAPVKHVAAKKKERSEKEKVARVNAEKPTKRKPLTKAELKKGKAHLASGKSKSSSEKEESLEDEESSVEKAPLKNREKDEDL